MDYAETRTISREPLLIKVSILVPEYLEVQLAGGPSHEPLAARRSHAEQTKLEREMAPCLTLRSPRAHSRLRP